MDSEFAVDLLTRFLETAGPEFMRRADAGLATPAEGKYNVDDPWGEPGGVFTVLTVGWRTGVLSRRRLATARARGRLEPSVGITAYLLDDDGILMKSMDVDDVQMELSFMASVGHSDGFPAEIFFTCCTANADPVAAIALLRECVKDDLVYGEVMDPGSHMCGRGWRFPGLSEVESGWLRSCNWVTLVRPELVAALPSGLLDQLRARLFSVDAIGGSLWLQATETLSEFGREEHRVLRELLAPILAHRSLRPQVRWPPAICSQPTEGRFRDGWVVLVVSRSLRP